MKWYSSDSHFGHANSIKHSNRPFSSVEEMDEVLIANWNAVVGKKDEVYHLGDFAFKSDVEAIVARLNGIVHLIHGNHDPNTVRNKSCWASSRPYAEVKDSGESIVLFHYPIHSWNRKHYGIYHFYGHTHGNFPGVGRSLDVGVDCWDYKPVSFEQIKQRLTETGEIDNFGFDRKDTQGQ